MAMTLITTNTVSNAASSAITSGIDSTYKLYIFKFININPATDDVNFTFNGSDDTSSHSYDITKTTTYFDAQHTEAGGSEALNYKTGHDLAQATGYQNLAYELGNGADESFSGQLWLFNPSGTTYAKHFYTVANYYHSGDQSTNPYVAGYFNTTAAITALDFKMSSGNFDGLIKMYGVG